jgi:hypothetical protein
MENEVENEVETNEDLTKEELEIQLLETTIIDIEWKINILIQELEEKFKNKDYFILSESAKIISSHAKTIEKLHKKIAKAQKAMAKD